MHTSPASPTHLQSPLCSTIFNLGLLATISSLIGLALIARASQFIPNPPVFPTGGTPQYVGVADVDKNGIPDIVVSNTNGVISVVLGLGHGAFQSPKVIGTFSGGAPPIAVADFNHDGFPDVAVLVGVSNSVWVYIGYGNGTFALPTKTATGAGPAQIAVGDVNGDGRLDIVAVTRGGLSTLLGKGNGWFQPAINTAISPTGNDQVVLGDLNGDGRLDAIVGKPWNEDVVLFGSGNGHFTQHSTFNGCGSGTFTGPTLRDINGDGRLDLISTGWEEMRGAAWGCICSLLGNGDGTFSGFKMQPFEGVGPNLAFADFNKDGKLDMAAANGDYLGAFFGVGSTLANQTEYRVGPWSGSVSLSSPPVAAADFTGDGWPDLAVGTKTGVQIVKNLGKGVFYAPPAIVVPPTNASHTTAYVTSLDLTGHRDIAVDSLGGYPGGDQSDVVTLFGDGTGRFPISFDPQLGFDIKSFGIGDFNRDGKLDLFYYQPGDSWPANEFQMALNTGKRSFLRGPVVRNVFGQAPIAGDFNNDGYSDLAIANGSHIEIYMNHGNGTYSTPTAYSAGDSPTFLLQTDINKDGKRDILAADGEGNQIVVLLGNGNGTFQPPHFVPLSAAPSELTIGDFNRDGKVDLAVACGKAIKILLGDGKGNFSSLATYNQKYAVTSLAQADLRRNGKEDILFTNGSLGILYGNGDGTFGSLTTYTVGAYPLDVAASDLNEDGSPDVVVVDGGSDAITMLLNQRGTRITLMSSAASVYVHTPVTFTATVTGTVSGSAVPTGTVAFKDGSRVMGTATLSSGTAKFTTSSLIVGTHTITASYSGSASFNPRTSTGLTEKVLP